MHNAEYSEQLGLAVYSGSAKKEHHPAFDFLNANKF